MFETIGYQVEKEIAWVRLNRPETLNAFISQMNKEVKMAVRNAEADDHVRCIVITGEGRAFCSGQDLSEVDESMDHGEVIREHYSPMIKQIVQCEKPIIAAVNGVAAGAGFSLALACDFRLASEKASFLNAFIHVGLIPDSGNLYFLSKLIGRAKATELAILGERISAQQAEHLGIVTKVIPMDDWQEEVMQFSTKIAQMPTKTIGLIKRYLHLAEEMPFEDYLEQEAQGQRIAGLTADHREGVQAFLEKRKPAFIGK
ncbi:MAG: enoyl-CoA hydratase-related protein [Bacillus sp. (in: firmicutes)]